MFIEVDEIFANKSEEDQEWALYFSEYWLHTRQYNWPFIRLLGVSPVLIFFCLCWVQLLLKPWQLSWQFTPFIIFLFNSQVVPRRKQMITEPCNSLKETLKIIQLQPPAVLTAASHQIRLCRAASNLALIGTGYQNILWCFKFLLSYGNC